MSSLSKRTLGLAGGLIAAAALLGVPSTVMAASDSVVMAKDSIDVSTICGTKPTVVGLSDGFGGNTWRKEALAELKDEASKCPNVTKVLYTNGQGDPQKTAADINGLVAQGVNVLLLFPDFGPAEIPAMRQAVQAGVVVIPYNGNPGGSAPQDYTANVYQDLDRIGTQWADFLGTHLKEGTLLYLSGPPGNAFPTNLMEAFKKQLVRYPGLKLLDQNYIPANWNPADAQKAMAGAITKYGQIDAVVTDFAPVALGVIRTFQQANLKIPYMVGLSSNNELNCLYADQKAKGAAWPYMTLDGTVASVRNAFRRGMADYQGTTNPEPLGMQPYVFADSFAGIEPKCDHSAPLDADLSGLLTPDQLQAVFKQ
jgi:ribose transport system substrate-binding protein